MPSPRSSAASIRVRAFRATLETLYAGVLAPILLRDPAPLETLTILPPPLLRISGTNALAVLQAPKVLVSSASRTTSRSAESGLCQVS